MYCIQSILQAGLQYFLYSFRFADKSLFEGHTAKKVNDRSLRLVGEDKIYFFISQCYFTFIVHDIVYCSRFKLIDTSQAATSSDGPALWSAVTAK
jgi:hypothetical protein